MSQNQIEKPTKAPDDRLNDLDRMAGAYHINPKLFGEEVRARFLREADALQELFAGNDIALAKINAARAFLTPVDKKQAA